MLAKDTWQGVPAIGYRNDVEFTTDILDEVESLYCINPSRITVTGKSDGAGFNNLLACDSILSKRIAAFAPVSGAYRLWSVCPTFFHYLSYLISGLQSCTETWNRVSMRSS